MENQDKTKQILEKEKTSEKITLHNLKFTQGARKNKTRVGRGHAAGKGKQAGRGQSGQKKRSRVRPGFEGGQNPLFRRIPKRGFTNFNRVEFQIVTLSNLNKIDESIVISEEILRQNGLIKRRGPVKILFSEGYQKKHQVVPGIKLSKRASEFLVVAVTK